MPEQPKTKRRRDKSPKVKKHITLSPAAYEKIQQFADDNNSSFSAAIETAALLGVGSDTATATLPVVANQIHRSIRSALRSLIAPVWFAGHEAGQTRLMVESMMLLLHKVDYCMNSIDYHGVETEQLPASVFPEQGREDRKIRDYVRTRAKHQTHENMRQPLEELIDMLMMQGGYYDDE